MIAQIDPKTRQARYFDIRRLTPREVYRLMGVSDDDIDLLLTTRLRGAWQEGDPQLTLFGEEEWNDMLTDEIHVPIIPASDHYMLAGNSIVVDVLTAILRQMFRPGITNGDDTAWNYRHPSDRPVNVVTICSGYDAQCLAMRRLVDELADDISEPPLTYRLVAWAEFDPESQRPLNRQPAVVAHNLLFPDAEKLNLGDMTKIDWEQIVPKRVKRGDVDLLTYSTPCVDISKAGKQAGIAKDSGTRSAVLWYTEQAIQALKPRFLLQENVSALVGQKAMPHFRQWLDTVSALGYRNYWAVLNSKKYGVPQNRERLFCVSVREDICPGAVFAWPTPQALTRVIADIIDKQADRRFFLPAESVIAFLRKRGGQEMIYVETDRKFTEAEIIYTIEHEQQKEA